jgi:hypothetical protein
MNLMNQRLTRQIVLIFALFVLSVSFFAAISHADAKEIPFFWNHINVHLDVQAN